MRILITGATGYIGSSFVRHLVRSGDHSVFAVIRHESDLSLIKPYLDSVELMELSRKSHSIAEIVRTAKPDIVVHLAASQLHEHTNADLLQLLDSNIVFGTELVDAMVTNGVSSLVNTGTFWEYMDGGRNYRPVNLYAAAKFAFNNILKYYHETKSLNILTLNLFNVYGPNHPRMKVFRLFSESLSEKTPVPLTPGEQVLDMVYVDDVLDAYEKAVERLYTSDSNLFEIIDIGYGVGYKLRDIAILYEEISQKKLNVEWGGIPYRDREIMHGVADINDAKRILGWEPRYNLREGIISMLRLEQQASGSHEQ